MKILVFERVSIFYGKLIMRKAGDGMRRSTISLVFVSVAFFVCGTNACQENYNFAKQVSLSPTETETETETETVTATPTETVTKTGSETPTPSSTLTETPTSSVTDDEEEDEDESTESVNEFLISLSKDHSTSYSKQGVLGINETEETGDGVSNWLGHIYDKGDGGMTLDSDGDGFGDGLEKDFGTDPNDSNDFPRTSPVTSLMDRYRGVDDDLDGVPNSEEIVLGTDPNNADSDGDGVNDGAEILSKSDPLDRNSMPKDFDHDGLADDFEIQSSYNWKDIDTDGDGLRDDVELALGTSIFDNDSDSDGILDGKEVQLGSDPLTPEYR